VSALLAAAADRLTRRVVGRFRWDHQSQLVEAYRELLPVVRDELAAFERQLLHRARRLRPLAAPPEEPDAPE
jgi:hypothetical protein